MFSSSAIIPQQYYLAYCLVNHTSAVLPSLLFGSLFKAINEDWYTKLIAATTLHTWHYLKPTCISTQLNWITDQHIPISQHCPPALTQCSSTAAATNLASPRVWKLLQFVLSVFLFFFIQIHSFFASLLLNF